MKENLKEVASNADEQYSKICKRREWGGEVISLSGKCFRGGSASLDSEG